MPVFVFLTLLAGLKFGQLGQQCVSLYEEALLGMAARPATALGAGFVSVPCRAAWAIAFVTNP